MSNQKEVVQISKEIQNFTEELVGGAAHEINNLIYVINMSSEMLDLTDDPDKKKEMIANIEEKSQSISKILASLRTVVKDASAEEPQIVSVQSMAEEVIQLCKRRFNNHQVILKTVFDENISLNSKRTQIIQSMLNILINSYDAIAFEDSPQKWVEYKFQVRGKELDIVIRDSAKLLTFDESKNLFSMEYKKGGRTGLPLVIAKDLIEQNQGTLTYSNSEDINEFKITFPQFIYAQSQEMDSVSSEMDEILESLKAKAS